MMEPNAKNTYAIPASSEEVSVASSPEVARATQEALQYAIDAQQANPENFDRRRVEGLGASMLSAAEAPSAPEVSAASESWWEDPAVLGTFGVGTVHFRSAALQAQGATRDDYVRGA